MELLQVFELSDEGQITDSVVAQVQSQNLLRGFLIEILAIGKSIDYLNPLSAELELTLVVGWSLKERFVYDYHC